MICHTKRKTLTARERKSADLSLTERRPSFHGQEAAAFMYTRVDSVFENQSEKRKSNK